MPLIDRIDADLVRAALDPLGLDLNAETLDDKVIQNPIYAGAAISEVLNRDPGAEGRDATAKEHVTNALNLLTAANLAPFVSSVLKEEVEGSSLTRDKVDWGKRAAALRNRAYEELAAATGPTVTRTSLPRLFGTARVRRC
jgi:hypothetical protein